MINTKDIKFLKMSIKICKNVSIDFRSRHAAILTINNKIISIGINKSKTHPLQKKYSRHPSLTAIHAEIDCLSRVDKDSLDGHRTTLYIAMINPDGSPHLSCPCSGCSKAINDYNIDRIIYTTNDGIAERIKS